MSDSEPKALRRSTRRRSTSTVDSEEGSATPPVTRRRRTSIINKVVEEENSDLETKSETEVRPARVLTRRSSDSHTDSPAVRLLRNRIIDPPAESPKKGRGTRRTTLTHIHEETPKDPKDSYQTPSNQDEDAKEEASDAVVVKKKQTKDIDSETPFTTRDVELTKRKLRPQLSDVKLPEEKENEKTPHSEAGGEARRKLRPSLSLSQVDEFPECRVELQKFDQLETPRKNENDKVVECRVELTKFEDEKNVKETEVEPKFQLPKSVDSENLEGTPPKLRKSISELESEVAVSPKSKKLSTAKTSPTPANTTSPDIPNSVNKTQESNATGEISPDSTLKLELSPENKTLGESKISGSTPNRNSKLLTSEDESTTTEKSTPKSESKIETPEKSTDNVEKTPKTEIDESKTVESASKKLAVSESKIETPEKSLKESTPATGTRIEISEEIKTSGSTPKRSSRLLKNEDESSAVKTPEKSTPKTGSKIEIQEESSPSKRSSLSKTETKIETPEKSSENVEKTPKTRSKTEISEESKIETPEKSSKLAENTPEIEISEEIKTSESAPKSKTESKIETPQKSTIEEEESTPKETPKKDSEIPEETNSSTTPEKSNTELQVTDPQLEISESYELSQSKIETPEKSTSKLQGTTPKADPKIEISQELNSKSPSPRKSLSKTESKIETPEKSPMKFRGSTPQNQKTATPEESISNIDTEIPEESPSKKPKSPIKSNADSEIETPEKSPSKRKTTKTDSENSDQSEVSTPKRTRTQSKTETPTLRSTPKRNSSSKSESEIETPKKKISPSTPKSSSKTETEETPKKTPKSIIEETSTSSPRRSTKISESEVETPKKSPKSTPKTEKDSSLQPDSITGSQTLKTDSDIKNPGSSSKVTSIPKDENVTSSPVKIDVEGKEISISNSILEESGISGPSPVKTDTKLDTPNKSVLKNSISPPEKLDQTPVKMTPKKVKFETPESTRKLRSQPESPSGRVTRSSRTNSPSVSSPKTNSPNSSPILLRRTLKQKCEELIESKSPKILPVDEDLTLTPTRESKSSSGSPPELENIAESSPKSPEKKLDSVEVSTSSPQKVLDSSKNLENEVSSTVPSIDLTESEDEEISSTQQPETESDLEHLILEEETPEVTENTSKVESYELRQRSIIKTPPKQTSPKTEQEEEELRLILESPSPKRSKKVDKQEETKEVESEDSVDVLLKSFVNRPKSPVTSSEDSNDISKILLPNVSPILCGVTPMNSPVVVKPKSTPLNLKVDPTPDQETSTQSESPKKKINLELNETEKSEVSPTKKKRLSQSPKTKEDNENSDEDSEISFSLTQSPTKNSSPKKQIDNQESQVDLDSNPEIDSEISLTQSPTKNASSLESNKETEPEISSSQEKRLSQSPKKKVETQELDEEIDSEFSFTLALSPTKSASPKKTTSNLESPKKTTETLESEEEKSTTLGKRLSQSPIKTSPKKSKVELETIESKISPSKESGTAGESIIEEEVSKRVSVSPKKGGVSELSVSSQSISDNDENQVSPTKKNATISVSSDEESLSPKTLGLDENEDSENDSYLATDDDSEGPVEEDGFVDLEAMENSGSDTPSDGSNDIIEMGESISESSNAEEEEDDYDNDSFIVSDDLEDPNELLSGTGDDLSDGTDDSDIEIISQSKSAKAMFNKKHQFRRIKPISLEFSDESDESSQEPPKLTSTSKSPDKTKSPKIVESEESPHEQPKSPGKTKSPKTVIPIIKESTAMESTKKSKGKKKKQKNDISVVEIEDTLEESSKQEDVVEIEKSEITPKKLKKKKNKKKQELEVSVVCIEETPEEVFTNKIESPVEIEDTPVVISKKKSKKNKKLISTPDIPDKKTKKIPQEVEKSIIPDKKSKKKIKNQTPEKLSKKSKLLKNSQEVVFTPDRFTNETGDYSIIEDELNEPEKPKQKIHLTSLVTAGHKIPVIPIKPQSSPVRLERKRKQVPKEKISKRTKYDVPEGVHVVNINKEIRPSSSGYTASNFKEEILYGKRVPRQSSLQLINQKLKSAALKRRV